MNNDLVSHILHIQNLEFQSFVGPEKSNAKIPLLTTQPPTHPMNSI